MIEKYNTKIYYIPDLSMQALPDLVSCFRHGHFQGNQFIYFIDYVKLINFVFSLNIIESSNRSLWSDSHGAWSQYRDYFPFTHFKMDLDHFYFDNIDFKLFDLALILITYIFKASEWKQDGLAEESEMIQVRLLNLILK